MSTNGHTTHIYKNIWEANTGEQLLCQCENDHCAHPFAVMPGCQGVHQALLHLTRPCFLLVVLLLSTLLCSLPQPSHAGQLEKGDPVYQGHCQWGASSATQCAENSWLENLVTPGWTMKITKISTPRKLPAIQYIHKLDLDFVCIVLFHGRWRVDSLIICISGTVLNTLFTLQK